METVQAVIGLGYVGVPLAVAFAESGFKVIGVDVSEEKAKVLNQGTSITPDVSDERVQALVAEGRLEATTDFSRVSEADLISICVPTPLSKSKDPDISYIVSACDAIVPHVKEGAVVVLESTTYPGTTREIILPRFEKRGFKVGENLFLAFSPERVDPGNETWNIRNTPKVVGGLTKECGRRAAELYGRALETIIPVQSAESAEMVKLLENTFRAINIGLVNELAMVCSRLGLNAWEIIDAAASKPFGFMAFRPGPGLGGHCIPIDPLYLSWKMRMLDYRVRFIDLADEVNSFMPEYVVRRCGEILNEYEKSVKGSRVLLMGVAYKKDIDDVRESPALDLYEKLVHLGARVVYHDPYVKSFNFRGETTEGISWDQVCREDFDLILIATDHSRTDYATLAKRGIPVLDTRNALKGFEGEHLYTL